MTDMKHTPGLVVDLSTTNGHCGFGVSTEDGIQIATVYADLIECGRLPSERASQPENQESVYRAKRIVHTWNCHGRTCDGWIQAAQTAIKSARGES